MLDMRPLLGDKTNEAFEKLAAAPTELSEVLKDPDVADFVKALQDTDPRFENTESLVENFLTLRQQPQVFPKASFDVIDTFRGKPGLEKLDVFARAYVLRNTWKMDPRLMVRINQQYGRTSLAESPLRAIQPIRIVRIEAVIHRGDAARKSQNVKI